VTIPEAELGIHGITAVDYSYNLNATVNVVPNLILEPSEGPVGTVVKATGYGFPASDTTTDYNVTLTWYGYETFDWGWALTNSIGKFVLDGLVVPHDYGGDHLVTAVCDDSPTFTTATEYFEITAMLWIDPAEFSNDCSLVHAVGTGFNPELLYSPNIDNNHLAINLWVDEEPIPGMDYWMNPTNLIANATGDIDVAFVAAGFRPGLHVFSLYPTSFWPNQHIHEPTYACFTVTTDGD
jgi:hypothetical protein